MEKGQLQCGLEDALKALAKAQNEEIARQIKPILLTNLDRGRMQTFVGEDPARIQAYVWLVAQNFSSLNPYLHQLQIERNSVTWQPLFERMLTWAYSFFVRKNFLADDHTREIASECATEAAISLLNGHFPYDTDFDPWAHTIVINYCRKYIQNSLKKSHVPEEKKVELVDDLNDPHELLLEARALQNESGSELQAALEQLSEARRSVIQYVYFDELSPAEIAERMGKTVNAVYGLQFNALQDLRKILGTNRDNTNE